ncbi:MAG: M23 family metallopeptidase [Myxococcales bacterium]|nr:M23 family metallopeptidase [Myxococcales bacterium]
MHWLSSVLLVVAAASASPASAAGDLERGRELTELLLSGNFSQVWPALASPLQMALGGPEGFAEFQRRLDHQLGDELRVTEESSTRDGDLTIYTRRSDFERSPTTVRTVWTLDGSGTAHGLSIRPEPARAAGPAPSRHLERATRTPLRLPFEGEWTVFWGGRSVEQNYHAGTVDQRFALDLVVMVDGATHTGEPGSNANYHCWGQPILAPGAGLVVAAEDGIRDNTPGETNRRKPPGNHVVLDHLNGEYSFLAHLQKGSVRVRAGEDVSAGAPLGLCGNSGNSSEPHLHYHLQDTPEFGAGEGLPAFFHDYLANDTPVEEGEPTRGQRVRPAPGS